MSVTTCTKPGLTIKNLPIFLAVLLILSGCGESSSNSTGFGGDTTGSDDDIVSASVLLTSNTTTINHNDSITLNWSTNNVDNCAASGDWSGNKSTTGSEVIESLVADSNFVLTCSGAGVDISYSSQISVSAPSYPIVSNINPANYSWSTLTIGEEIYIDRNFIYTSVPSNYEGFPVLKTASDDRTSSGDNFISFNIDQATTIYVAHADNGSNLPGWLSSWTQTGELLSSNDANLFIYKKNFSTGTVTLGGNGNAIYMYSVFIASSIEAALAPTVVISVNPTNVVIDGQATLSWSSDNTSDCTASGDWSGSKATSGSQTINALIADSTFSLTCIGSGGSANDSVGVVVSALPAPIVNLTASATNLPYNGSVTLSWGSDNTSDCSASGDWSGSKATSGSQTINALIADSTFSLSCIGPGGSANDSAGVVVSALPAPIVNLTASATSLPYNGSITLSWGSDNTSDCSASGDWSGSKATSGSQTINALIADSTFSLSCIGPGGSANDSAGVVVSALPAPIVNLTASATSLPYNGSITLSWGSDNTSDCSASGDWSGSKATSGSQTINALIADSTFSLSCIGPGGSANDSASVAVSALTAPIVNLTASVTSLPYNGSITLSWSSDDTSDCTASGDWSGSKTTSGAQTISALTTDSSFSLTCSGPNGSADDSVSITVAAPLPTLTFSANPNSVTQNGSTILNWNTTGATSCLASGDWSGSKGTAGSQTISSLTIDGQYTLTCTGSGGTIDDTVNVTVVLNLNGTALLSWTPPTENTDGSPLAELAGYKIKYGTSPNNYSESIIINNPALTSYLVENLASSTWYFSMTAFNSGEIESNNSVEVSKTIN